jgi:RNA-directed DNA polymerase
MILNLKNLAYTLKCRCTSTELEKITSQIDNYYKRKEDIKIDSNGKDKIRILYPSLGRLKEIQERINSQILAKIDLPNFLFGGVKGKTNILNANEHKGKKYKFTTDLKKYFPSISWHLVYGMFLEYGFSPDVSRLLTKLTTYKGMLPQGSPTSTSIANLVFIPVDIEINNFCKGNKITYTRFVDDLSMSSPTDFKECTNYILDFIRKANFRINHSKTSYGTKASVTGIDVGNNSLKATKKFLERLSNSTELSENQLQGRKAYLKRIKKINNAGRKTK